MNKENVITGGDMTRPVIIFNFAYDIYMPGSDKPPERVFNHPEMKGTIHNDGQITYPTIEAVQEFLKTNLIAKHNIKKVKLDDSWVSVLSPVTYQYKVFDFKSLPVFLNGEPKELITAIRDHIIHRAGGSL